MMRDLTHTPEEPGTNMFSGLSNKSGVVVEKETDKLTEVVRVCNRIINLNVFIDELTASYHK